MTTRVWLRTDLPDDEPAAPRQEFPDVEFVVGETLAPEQLAAVQAVFLIRMPDDNVFERMANVLRLHGTMGGVGAAAGH